MFFFFLTVAACWETPEYSVDECFKFLLRCMLDLSFPLQTQTDAQQSCTSLHVLQLFTFCRPRSVFQNWFLSYVRYIYQFDIYIRGCKIRYETKQGRRQCQRCSAFYPRIFVTCLEFVWTRVVMAPETGFLASRLPAKFIFLLYFLYFMFEVIRSSVLCLIRERQRS